MIPNNPRFPHTCVIWRQIVENPLVDEDIAFDPLADEDVVEPSQEETDEPKEEDLVKKVIVYQGTCRAYDKNTTSDRGEIITSYRGLALPITREGWQELGVVPMEGDELEVDRGGYKEYGRVVDKNPANFGGTHLVWRYGRN